METFIKLLDVVVWPLVVLVAMFIFRRALTKLIGRLKSFESNNNKLVFDQEIQQFEQMVVNFEPVENDETASNDWKAKMLEVAKISPRAAIIEAWTSIELACIEAGMRSGTVGPQRFYPKMLEDFLYKTEGFDGNKISQIMKMRQLRNTVVHGRDQDFDYIDSEKYIDLADKVLRAVKSIA